MYDSATSLCLHLRDREVVESEHRQMGNYLI